MMRFEHFVAIDWSGAKGERLRGIAIAQCAPGSEAPALVQPGRRWSRAEVLDWLKTDLPPNSLVGLDLSPGLPFDIDGGFFPGWVESPASAKALWRHVDELCAHDPHLAASSFVAHSEARRYFRHGKGDCGDRFESGDSVESRTGRLRETERRQKKLRLSPSSCFNLVGAAQVGKSSLTGMRILHRLDGVIPIWPFDPLPTTGSVIVEIYTSLAARAADIPPGRSKMLTGRALDDALEKLGVEEHATLPHYTDHATDAILTSAWLRHVSDEIALWNPEGLSEVRDTEGWTFGVA